LTPLTVPALDQADGTPQTSETPWSRLFKDIPLPHDRVDPALRQLLVPPTARSDTRPSCIMPVLESDPSIDPGIIVVVPESNVRFSMPIIEGSCKPAAAAWPPGDWSPP
jgi:hypothetical protein